MNIEQQNYFAPVCTPQEWEGANPLKKQDMAAYRAEQAVTQQYEWEFLSIEQAGDLLFDVFYDWDGSDGPMLWYLESAHEYEVSDTTGGFADSETNEIYIRSDFMFVPVVLHEAAHLLVPDGAAHRKEWRDVRDRLFKQYANIDMTLPAEAQWLDDLMAQLEEPAAEWWKNHDQIIRDYEP